MAKCSKSGKQLNDRNAMCPHGDKCEKKCSGNIVRKYNLVFDQVIVDENFVKYNELRQTYKALCKVINDLIEECRPVLGNLDKFIVKAPEVAREIVYMAVDATIKVLYHYGIIDFDVDAFLKKYYYKYINFEEYFEPILERYSEILEASEQLSRYRNIQNASKARWYGGGVGATGAIKGAIIAGVLNIGTDFLRSFGEAKVREEDSKRIFQEKNKLYKSECTEEKFKQALNNCVWGCFNGAVAELIENNVFVPMWFDDSKANAIYTNTINYEKNPEKLIENIIRCICISPYNYKYWEVLLNLENIKEFTDLIEYAKFLGILETHDEVIRAENITILDDIKKMPEVADYEIIKKIKAYLKAEKDIKIKCTTEIEELLNKILKWALDKESAQSILDSLETEFSEQLKRRIFKETLSLLEERILTYSPEITIEEIDNMIENISSVYDIGVMLDYAKKNNGLMQYKLSELFFPNIVMPWHELEEWDVIIDKKTVYDVVNCIFEKSMDEPNGFSFFMLAMAEYIYNEDIKEFENLIGKAIKLNCPAALYQMGDILSRDNSLIEKDFQKSLKYLHKAADMRYLPACVKLALWYQNGINGTGRNEKLYQKYAALAGGSTEIMKYGISNASPKHYENCKKIINEVYKIVWDDTNEQCVYLFLEEEIENVLKISSKTNFKYKKDYVRTVLDTVAAQYQTESFQKIEKAINEGNIEASMYYMYSGLFSKCTQISQSFHDSSNEQESWYIYPCMFGSEQWKSYMKDFDDSRFKWYEECRNKLPELLKKKSVTADLLKKEYFKVLEDTKETLTIPELKEVANQLGTVHYVIWMKSELYNKAYNLCFRFMSEMYKKDNCDEKVIAISCMLTSEDYLAKAAMNGSIEAVLELAKYYNCHTKNNEKEYKRLALVLYEKYAEYIEDGEVFNKIGLAYDNGVIVKRNYGIAAKWFEKSANAGFVAGMFNYGFCLENGDGVAQNYIKASQWYIRAIEYNHIAARTRLANLHLKGLGVPKNREKAISLYREAADAGDENAKKKLEKLQKGGCYITSAVCDSLDMPDDCTELQLLRQFRDLWLRNQEDGEELIERYYSTAPRIVEIINATDESREIYLSLYNDYILPCLDCIKSKEFAACKTIYILMVDTLICMYFDELARLDDSTEKTKDYQNKMENLMGILLNYASELKELRQKIQSFHSDSKGELLMKKIIKTHSDVKDVFLNKI